LVTKRLFNRFSSFLFRIRMHDAQMLLAHAGELLWMDAEPFSHHIST
jgi:hypothetical protein